MKRVGMLLGGLGVLLLFMTTNSRLQNQDKFDAHVVDVDYNHKQQRHWHDNGQT